MKKILIGFALFIIVILAAAFVLPMIYKDDIKAAIDKEIEKSVNADVVFDVNNFSLTIFRNFPNVTAEIKELGVFNRAPFEGEHLFVVERLDIEINLAKILFGDQLRLRGITLLHPQINIKVLADGRANYDIAKPSTDTVKATGEPSSFSFGIDHWEIINGDLSYDDKSIPYFLSITGLNHSGSGDFTQDVFDLRMHTVADTVTTSMGKMQFLNKKRIEMDAVISISENISKYTFKENTVKLNDFAMSFDGWFKMNPDNYDMDITFKSPANTFKSLLSLVPGMYTKDFKTIETKGDLTFAGFVKGLYGAQKMPAFQLNFQVKDAMFKYPALPTAVNNINMDLLVDNKDGNLDHTVVNLKKLHLDFGTNPVDAQVLIENLKDYRMKGSLQAKLNLAELGRMFPMEGLEMKGTYSVNASANGMYDSVRKIIPAINASMSLADGYVKSSKFPLPLQEMKMSATIKNTSGKMAETEIAVNDFSMVLDGEKLSAKMLLRNLDDYTWDIKANGGIDLEKMTTIFPLKGITLAGKVKADIETKGRMSDVNAKRYDKLPTSGSVSLTNFKYVTKDSPPLTLTEATAVFDPKKIQLTKMDGTIGKSDFNVNGHIENYLGFVLNNGTMVGNVNFKSGLLDLNEFMTESTTPSTADTTSFGVIPIPENIDFTLRSNIQTVKMMDYTMTNATGDILLKNGVANLSALKFNMMGGSFAVNGTYSTKDIKHPKYDLDLKIQKLSIQQAAHSFSIVSTYAPIAGLVSGDFSTNFKINGELTNKMMPNMATVNGDGLITIAQAALTKSTLLSGLTSLTKLNGTDQVSLTDVLMTAKFENGRFSVKPFEVKMGDYPATISGSTGLDASIDYSLKMLVPAGQAGAQLQGLLNQYTGSTNPTDKIPVNIGIGGTVRDPKPKLLMAEQKEQVKQAVMKEGEKKAQEAANQLLKGTKPDDVLKNLMGGGAKPDTTKKDSAATQKPVNQLMQLQNLLKKKKN